jgi:hypothetical protein
MIHHRHHKSPPHVPNLCHINPFRAPILLPEDTFHYHSPIYAYVLQVVSFPLASSKSCMHLSSARATCPTQLLQFPVASSQSLSAYVPPSMWDPTFHTHIKEQAKYYVSKFLICTALLTSRGASSSRSTSVFPCLCHSTVVPYSSRRYRISRTDTVVKQDITEQKQFFVLTKRVKMCLCTQWRHTKELHALAAFQQITNL